MNHFDIVKFKMQKLVEDQEEYTFPEMLSLARLVYNLRRKEVHKDTNIHCSRLYKLEKGEFKKPPTSEEIVILGNYYGINPSLLKSKMQEFLQNYKKLPSKSKVMEFRPGTFDCKHART